MFRSGWAFGAHISLTTLSDTISPRRGYNKRVNKIHEGRRHMLHGDRFALVVRLFTKFHPQWPTVICRISFPVVNVSVFEQPNPLCCMPPTPVTPSPWASIRFTRILAAGIFPQSQKPNDRSDLWTDGEVVGLSILIVYLDQTKRLTDTCDTSFEPLRSSAAR